MVICGLSLLTSALHAEQVRVGGWQLQTGGLSYHIPRGHEFNEVNLGLGLEYRWTEHTAVSFGFFRNSNNRNSRYVLAQYHPWEFNGVRFGVTGGIVNGYSGLRNGKFGPIAMPSFSVQWKHAGINVAIVPPTKINSAAFFVGIKIPIPIN